MVQAKKDNSILQSNELKEENEVIYFSNAKPCLKVTQHKTTGVAEKSSDHEESDTKFVLLVKAQNVLHEKTVMIRLSPGDITIIVLFILHVF